MFLESLADPRDNRFVQEEVGEVGRLSGTSSRQLSMRIAHRRRAPAAVPRRGQRPKRLAQLIAPSAATGRQSKATGGGDEALQPDKAAEATKPQGSKATRQ